MPSRARSLRRLGGEDAEKLKRLSDLNSVVVHFFYWKQTTRLCILNSSQFIIHSI